jgi:hypothetical protein
MVVKFCVKNSQTPKNRILGKIMILSLSCKPQQIQALLVGIHPIAKYQKNWFEPFADNTENVFLFFFKSCDRCHVIRKVCSVFVKNNKNPFFARTPLLLFPCDTRSQFYQPFCTLHNPRVTRKQQISDKTKEKNKSKSHQS